LKKKGEGRSEKERKRVNEGIQEERMKEKLKEDLNRNRGVKLTTHFQLMASSRKCGSIRPLPHTSSWRST
jgi:hypothetical protein